MKAVEITGRPESLDSCRAILVCVVCGNTDNPKSCGRCNNSYYCSRTCQRIHWPIHQAQCRALSTFWRSTVIAWVYGVWYLPLKNLLLWQTLDMIQNHQLCRFKFIICYVRLHRQTCQLRWCPLTSLLLRTRRCSCIMLSDCFVGVDFEVHSQLIEVLVHCKCRCACRQGCMYRHNNIVLSRLAAVIHSDAYTWCLCRCTLARLSHNRQHNMVAFTKAVQVDILKTSCDIMITSNSICACVVSDQ